MVYKSTVGLLCFMELFVNCCYKLHIPIYTFLCARLIISAGYTKKKFWIKVYAYFSKHICQISIQKKFTNLDFCQQNIKMFVSPNINQCDLGLLFL